MFEKCTNLRSLSLKSLWIDGNCFSKLPVNNNIQELSIREFPLRPNNKFRDFLINFKNVVTLEMTYNSTIIEAFNSTKYENILELHMLRPSCSLLSIEIQSDNKFFDFIAR